jgi:adenylate kinase family enzyme
MSGPASSPTAAKIAIKGSSAAGKTTLAAELARRLALTHIELDGLHHGPNWSAPAPDEFRARVLAEIERSDGRWVVDGNYDSKLDGAVIELADTIVWLDLPFYVKFGRLWSRTIRRIVSRAELWNGNRETWRGAFCSRDSIFIWLVRAHRCHRRAWPTKFGGDPRFIRLRSTTEVARWLNAVTRQSAGGDSSRIEKIDQSVSRISPR